jgi:hypothetical protein
MPTAPHSWLALTCLTLAGAFLLPYVRRSVTNAILRSPQRAFVATLATLTLSLSVAYVFHYLRGGPRIIDATSYWLQAHVFAQGGFSFAPPGPVHSFLGRFLVFTPNGELSVLFPPGYAAVLALGVWLRIPLLVNPLLGALCAVLTYLLGRQWFDEHVGRLAGILSALCAALRYHSADTMSHVFVACLGLGALLGVNTLSPRGPAAADDAAPSIELGKRTGGLLCAGLCVGWSFATRPVTGVVFGVGAVVYVAMQTWGSPASYGIAPSRIAALAKLGLVFTLGALPGLAFWLVYQWATTGSLGTTTQSLYYARSDWPLGCFRLGLSPHILQDYQPGYGAFEALQVTVRRLYQNNRDIVNLPWFPLLALLSLRRVPNNRPLTLAWSIIVLHCSAYALFYFDGNYPGGGARLFADVLPLEHIVLASVLANLRVDWLTIAAPALGFALWSAPAHDALAEREGGRPMFESSVLREAEVSHGLVFVTTDHGFNLGLRPNASPHTAPLIVRLRDDGFDYALWDHWGKPPAYRYEFDPFRPDAQPRLTPYQPSPTSTFAGASFWPPLESVSGGTERRYGAGCTSGASLVLRPEGEQHITLQLWAPAPGSYQLLVRGDGRLQSWDWPLTPMSPGGSAANPDAACTTWHSEARQLNSGAVLVHLQSTQPTAVSEVSLRPTADRY